MDNLKDDKKVVASLKVITDKYFPGEYPFAVYQWVISGERETFFLNLSLPSNHHNDT